jgi:hypothetical protein
MDGPGLWQRVARLYGTEIRAELAEVYRQTFESGACLEPQVKRTPGASFAPRPLRILSLLIELGSPGAPPPVDLAKEALVACGDAESRSPLIQGLQLLDDLRHLHMRDPSRADSKNLLALYRSRVARLSREQVPSRLTTLLQSALTRYEKYHLSGSQSA